MDYHIQQRGYDFKASYSHLNSSGMLFVRKETDGSLVRELPFPCKGEDISDHEVQSAIDRFFEDIDKVDQPKEY